MSDSNRRHDLRRAERETGARGVKHGRPHIPIKPGQSPAAKANTDRQREALRKRRGE